MSRWTRWQFVVPRLLLCAVVVLGAQYALGVAVRSITMRKASAVFGTPVDVSHARVSLSDGKILLSGVSAADPRCPIERLFAADSCELEIAASPLLHQQTIVERGRICGLCIGGAASGNDADARRVSNAAHTARWFSDDSIEQASARLTGIENRLHQDFVGQLESVKRTAVLCERVPNEISAIKERVAEFERHANELEKTINAAHSNSLRHDTVLNEVPARIAELREAANKINAEFEKLPQQLDEERRGIVAARRQDDQILCEQLRFEPIDHNLLNAYLLRDEVAQSLENLLACLNGIRQVLPANATRRAVPKRGQDVLFAGIRPTPDLLIRTLEVQGVSSVIGRPVELHGVICGLSTAPALHDVPIQVRLSATGTLPLELRASIDRTGGRVRDELIVDCHHLAISERSLGRANHFQLKLAPSVASFSVSARVEGDKLAGDLQLVQKKLGITSVFGGDLNDMPLEASLNATLSEVSSLATRVSLGGTIDRPSCTMWSNLGPAVAEALQRAVQRHSDERAQVILAEARRQVDEQLAGLDRQVADEQAKFASKMTGIPDRIETIAQRQTRRERLSVEQFGRRLPSNSLFR
ncbi:MAG: hypothetical protein L0228_17220 [Planctomycetes bacterium]|nr:hypothetical protein [Planctomycetota bacterium]